MKEGANPAIMRGMTNCKIIEARKKAEQRNITLGETYGGAVSRPDDIIRILDHSLFPYINLPSAPNLIFIKNLVKRKILDLWGICFI